MADEYISREALIKGRHACKRDCTTCDFAIDGDSWCEGELFVVDVLRAPAADVVDGATFRDCRNELCLRCGEYRLRYKGACDGCRWLEVEP